MHRHRQCFAIRDALSRRENSSCPDIPLVRCLSHVMPQNIAYVPTGVTRINAMMECVLLVDSARFSHVRWRQLFVCLSHIHEPGNTRPDDRWDRTVAPYSRIHDLLLIN